MSEVKPVIKTAEQRLKDKFPANNAMLLSDASDWINAFKGETAELRAALEALQAENAAQAKRILELELIEHVSRKLVECKGRYHTEQNMIALAKLFDVSAQKGTE